jgi:hypothetical protein
MSRALGHLLGEAAGSTTLLVAELPISGVPGAGGARAALLAASLAVREVIGLGQGVQLRVDSGGLSNTHQISYQLERVPMAYVQ